MHSEGRTYRRIFSKDSPASFNFSFHSENVIQGGIQDLIDDGTLEVVLILYVRLSVL